ASVPTGIAVGRASQRSLNVATAGSGVGVVIGNGIDCPGDCAEDYERGATVSLNATPAAGSTFAGWGGACSGTGSCAVSMDADRSVTAPCAARRAPLKVSTSGAGAGHITGPGIKCGVDCSGVYRDGTHVSLGARPGEHSKFVGWGGACSGKRTCGLTM